MVDVSASVNLPLHHKVEVLFWHRLTRVVPKKGHKTIVVWRGFDARIGAACNEADGG